MEEKVARRMRSSGVPMMVRTVPRGTGASSSRPCGRGLLRGDRGLGFVRRLDHVLRDGDEEAPADPGRVAPGGEHRGDAAEDAHEDDPAEVDLEQTGGGDRAGVRRQEGVGHGQAREERHAVEEDRLAAALRRRVDDRREDEDADVEEDGDAEDQAGQAHGERFALLAEEAEQPGAQHLGAAGDFEDRAEHGAQADDDGDVSEDAAHSGLDHRDGVGFLDRAEEFGDGEPGGQAHRDGDRQQCDERL